MPPRLAALALVVLTLTACGRADAPSDDGAVPELRPGGIVNSTPQGYGETLRSLRGRPVVVNFWATWCEPCKVEMPRLVDAYHRYEDQVGFLGVNVEDATDGARRFAREYRLPFPSLGDPRGEIRRDQHVVGLPTTQFYRADGELAFVHSGEIDSEELERKIGEVIRIGVPRRTPAG